MGLGGLLRRLLGRRAASPTLYAVDERVPAVGVGDANLVVYRDEGMDADEATVLRCRESVTFGWDLTAVDHGAYRRVTVAGRSVPVERIEPHAGDAAAPAWLADRTFPRRPTPDDIEAAVRRAMR
ncbi:MAG: hypothetical protein ABEH40_03280 [Haloferacaceae archaeon]